MLRYEDEIEQIQKQKVFDFSDDLKPKEEAETYFRSIGQITSVKLPRISRFGKIMAKQASQSEVSKKDGLNDVAEEDGADDATESGTRKSNASPEAKRKLMLSRLESQAGDDRSVRFPPIKRNQLVFKSQSVYNMNTRDDPDLPKSKSTFIKTGQKAPSIRTARTMPTPTPHRRVLTDVTSQKSRDDVDGSNAEEAEGGDSQQQRKRTRERTGQSEAALMQARTEAHNIPLPVQSHDSNPRPFVNPRFKTIQETLRAYEKERGMTSRDYAIQCLSVANSFKDKPWLQQVQQALTIAQRGVKKTVGRTPHIFKVKGRASSSVKRIKSKFSELESEAGTSRTFMTA